MGNVATANVGSWPKADVAVRDSDVRFRGGADIRLDPAECLQMTDPGLVPTARGTRRDGLDCGPRLEGEHGMPELRKR